MIGRTGANLPTELVRQIENEALQKLRRLDGERLYAYHQEL
jgi:DNA-directed RNA polymerase sigma subunit (sigma70/sigma32)